MAFHILIADEMHESLFPSLEELGVKYDYEPSIDREGIKQVIQRYDGIIIRSKTFIDAELLRNATGLKVICRAGAGIDNLDVEAINQRDIHLINAPEGNRDAVGEHCIGLLLSLLNKITLADAQIRQGIWDREGSRGIELKDKVVGIIGFGHMGSAFAERLQSFGCKILCYDKYKTSYGNAHIIESSLDEIFNQADIVSFHVPLTQETKFWVDEEFLRRFQKPVYLINTSRGEIISFKTIVNALKSGKIAGAALDVLENEKIKKLSPEQQVYFDQLNKSEKVLFTPHVAGWSHESYRRINTVIINKLKRFLNNF